MTLAAAGISIGLALRFLLSRAVTQLFYGIRPADPLVFRATTLAFVLVSLAATYLPAPSAGRAEIRMRRCQGFGRRPHPPAETRADPW